MVPRQIKKKRSVAKETQRATATARPRGVTAKGTTTRQAIAKEALRLINEKREIEGASVLEITKNLQISNGIFYYHFKDLDQLLEEVGQSVVANLVTEIQSGVRADLASRIARGPLIILRFVDRHPELHLILLRVLDDPTGQHANLGDNLRADLLAGKKRGRFAITDVDLAVTFCRAIVASAARAEYRGKRFEELGTATAVHTLTMLGLNHDEASQVVEREQEMLKVENSGLHPWLFSKDASGFR